MQLTQGEKLIAHGQGDSGTSQRLFGMFLTWMQERQSNIIVIATANDVSSMPPELLRKGRFDKIFFMDLPSHDERKEIWEIHLARKEPDQEFDIDLLAMNSIDFTGAEIEACVNEAVANVFYEDKTRMITTDDVMAVVVATKPQAHTSTNALQEIRSRIGREFEKAS